MSIFDILIVVAALLIFLTAVARLNDIKCSQNSKRWWVRRIGLMLVTVSMVMVIASYFTLATPYWYQVQRFTGLWGLALTWFTTPGMPPWWKYISKYDPKVG